MLVYRYEQNDGGGPFCTKEGILRSNPNIKFNDNFLSGCVSLKLLNDYWSKQKNNILYLKNCQLKIYDIPEKDIINTRTHILFPNTYKPVK